MSRSYSAWNEFKRARSSCVMCKPIWGYRNARALMSDKPIAFVPDLFDVVYVSTTFILPVWTI